MTTLFSVATPIGNLSDITFRAVDTLKNVDVIACEDTRVSGVLCEKYGIKTRLVSYHKFSESERLELFLDYLRGGKNVALISDAGTPLISDPGAKLIEAVRKEGFNVVPIVGASAVMALLSAIPRTREEFKFAGFLPRGKKQIRELIEANTTVDLVFYESPKRLLSALKALEGRKIAIGRELTKKFEEIVIDSAENLLEYYTNATLKGEITGMVYAKENIADEAEITEKIRKLKALNLSNKDISAILSELFGYSKNEVYKLALNLS